MRGGKDYDADFAQRMHGDGVWADLIRQRFEKAVERLGFKSLRGRFGRLDRSQFRRPVVVPATTRRGSAQGAGQLDLF